MLHAKEVVVRVGKASTLVVGIVVGALLVVAVPAIAQDAEEFPHPNGDAPLGGYTRGDGTIVLTDESFCGFLLSSLWGEDELTFAGLIDRTRKQKKARRAAFAPGSDEATLARCAEILSAYRTEAPEDDSIVAWARRAPVVPESLVGLLPDDFVADPLSLPGEVKGAARTSGYGSLVSAPFSVTGGTWLAALDARACVDWSGSLIDARDATNVVELVDDREFLYHVEPGHYYWAVTASECDWSVDLVPVQLGPEPTPTPEPRAVVPQMTGPHPDRWDRIPGAQNPQWLTAAQAREAVFEAGLVPGDCTIGEQWPIAKDRVWQQDPAADSLADFGSAVDVWIGQDCDIYLGERIE
jgi:hypothetical protein